MTVFRASIPCTETTYETVGKTLALLTVSTFQPTLPRLLADGSHPPIVANSQIQGFTNLFGSQNLQHDRTVQDPTKLRRTT